MQTVLLAAQRVGAGKTTLAVNLAVCAHNAMVVDLDRQQAAVDWRQRREQDWPMVFGAREDEFLDLVDHAQAQNVDWLFIDTATHVGADVLGFLLQYATTTLIPSRPGLLDICAAGSTARIVRGEGATGALVLNGIPPQSGRMTETLVREAVIEANRYGVPVCERMVAQRTDLQRSLHAGEGVTEAAPDSKAAAEIRALLTWLADQSAGEGASSAAAPAPLRL